MKEYEVIRFAADLIKKLQRKPNIERELEDLTRALHVLGNTEVMDPASVAHDLISKRIEVLRTELDVLDARIEAAHKAMVS